MFTAQLYTKLKIILDCLFFQNASLIPTILFLLKRKKTELRRLQNPNLELKFEVKVKFNGLNPHPIFQVAKLEHKTTPAPFIVTYIEFHSEECLPDIAYGKIVYCNPYSGLNMLHLFNTTLLLFITNVLLYSTAISHLTIPILQIFWFLIMTVQNSITFTNLTY